jgi:hypothetical protein
MTMFGSWLSSEPCAMGPHLVNMPFVYAIRLPYSQPILSIKLGVDPYDFFKALNCSRLGIINEDLEISFFWKGNSSHKVEP